MAGLDSNKKRSNSGNKRVSRFSEVLGAAHENTQLPGYPKNQPSEQLDTQLTEESLSQPLNEVKSQPPEILTTQLPEQLDIQVIDKSSSQLSEQVKSQTSDNPTAQIAGYPEIQLLEKLTNQEPQQPVTRSSKQLKDKDKLAKRENPDYTQTTFRIPKKLSRQINRVLMDLADEGVEVDRSDLLEELASAFIRIVDEVGAVEALAQIKHLGIQMDE